MKTIAFFNNKGGVGKTSLVYHLAWMFADKGKKVLAVDLDPQANLSSMFIPEGRLEKLWDEGSGNSIIDSLRPLQEGEGLGKARTETIANGLQLMAGHLELSKFEDRLSDSWARSSDGEVLSLRFLSAFHSLISEAAQQNASDLALIDVGPNLGAINRSAMLASDHVILPLAPDLYSLQGMKNLGPTLREWRRGWEERKKKAKERSSTIKFSLPDGGMHPAGYVLMQHAIRDGRPVQAYTKWAQRIPDVYSREVMDDNSPKNPSTEIRKVEEDSNCLAMLKHYRSLMPMAMEAHKPIFRLTSADGAIGAHTYAVQNCKKDFEQLADRVLKATEYVGAEESALG